ncbi:serine hydrolase domain-containing protein [Maribacter polysaccharolyticus]|uniref:serine hydrolase domain-containing protein n=1 Tax=Maribacter polysaccharolyticus TaxID=3020831 RepID=UPI00237EF7A6|nr:serine hydrolase domain-containing protein [Maribacter polysaccharolyticus]MDE3740907.1 serine hydrolase [Maribacter polysaccharolyticus]
MTTLIKFIISTLITVMLLSSCTNDDREDIVLQDPSGITSATALSAYLDAMAEQENVPGFAVSIVKDGTIVYQEAFGYANIADQVAYTNQTVTQIASVSKTFVGAAVAKAIAQGYFTLETDINDLLPVTVTNPKQPDAEIKIKHLVTHTSGLLDNPQVYLAHNYYILPGEDTSTAGAHILMDDLGMQQREKYALSEFLSEYFLEDGAMYDLDNFAPIEPGVSWSYSNLATGLTGLIIENVTGQSFDTYVKEHILQPLQMNASTYAIEAVDMEEMATAYINDATPLPFYANDSYPEGGLYSTNEDMGKYLLDMVNGVNGASSTLFSQAGYANLFNAHLENGIVPNDFAENHGLFWYMKDDKVMHGGNDLGVSTHLELHGNGNSGYVFLSNIDASFNGNMQQYQSIFSKIDTAIGQFLQAD